MTVGLRLFLSSMTFAIVIAVAYWLVAREIAGTFLLGFMAFALAVIAGAARRSDSTPASAPGGTAAARLSTTAGIGVPATASTASDRARAMRWSSTAPV